MMGCQDVRMISNVQSAAQTDLRSKLDFMNVSVYP